MKYLADVASPEVAHQRCSAAGGVDHGSTDAQAHNHSIALQTQKWNVAPGCNRLKCCSTSVQVTVLQHACPEHNGAAHVFNCLELTSHSVKTALLGMLISQPKQLISPWCICLQ
jgi:hypothetical protein